MGEACESVDWNPLGSAGAHSQLAGVVAGLVFAGIVMLIDRGTPRRPSAEALTMFIAGLVTFALDSFFFGVIAGERTCPRVWTQTTVAAGMLGVGSLTLFTGLAWLIAGRSEFESPLRLIRVVAYGLSLVTVGQLTVTAHDYLRDVRPEGAYPWLDWLVRAWSVLVALVVVGHAVARRSRYGAHRAVRHAAYLGISYVLSCALIFGLLTAADRSYWLDGVPPGVFVAAALLSVMLPGLVVVVQMTAFPPLTVPVGSPVDPALPAPREPAPPRTAPTAVQTSIGSEPPSGPDRP
ncbi:hypothetical protein O7626_08600 [Micromonospora sp. WMMD1102]|uniref:hypothetical protein n=1 Tax=Micromonospora sp. WMMD1102 TaxID=3016105 RepID=UPI002415477F|nr:hypothetical protein [Micromonospora sp. WMMD1102]MDG4785983.1 hypothetical protein [Micromonospora sp. WMMD1102]